MLFKHYWSEKELLILCFLVNVDVCEGSKIKDVSSWISSELELLSDDIKELFETSTRFYFFSETFPFDRGVSYL